MKSEKTLAERALGVLGMANGAGVVICGHEKIRSGFSKQPPVLWMAASDASRAEAERLRRSLPEGLPCCRLFSIAQLSAALGRDKAVFVALRKHGLSDVLLKLVVALNESGNEESIGPGD